MKKTIVVLVLLVSVSSYAVMNIEWYASAGWYFGTDVNAGILAPDGSGKSTIAQLVYSADTNVNFALAGGLASGNDSILGQFTITEGSTAGSKWGDFNVQSYTNDTFTAGYVYARVFQDNSIAANDWYYYTTPIALINLTDYTSVQDLQMNTDLSNGNSINTGTNVAQVQAIPEPATFLLFGMGATGAWLLRRKQRAA